MKIIRNPFGKTSSQAKAFEKKCKETIQKIKEAIKHSDEEGLFESEKCINVALVRLKEARRIVDETANYYNFTSSSREKDRA